MTSSLTKNGIRALAALAIGFATAVIAPPLAEAGPNMCLYINSSGERISSIFSGLSPDARFAQVLSPEIAHSDRKEPGPRFQNLVYREGCPKKAPRNVALPQGTTCNGYFMASEYLSCGLACGDHAFKQFCSCGTFDCSGYYYAGDACNGCELLELSCDPCA